MVIEAGARWPTLADPRLRAPGTRIVEQAADEPPAQLAWRVAREVETIAAQRPIDVAVLAAAPGGVDSYGDRARTAACLLGHLGKTGNLVIVADERCGEADLADLHFLAANLGRGLAGSSRAVRVVFQPEETGAAKAQRWGKAARNAST